MKEPSGAADETSRRERDQTDRQFEILSNGHRRRILAALLDAERLRIGEDEALGRVLDDTGPRLELVHVHLPKLREGEFVEWDRNGGVVRRGRRFADIAPLVRFVRENGLFS